jgi:hypothetical protein
MRGSPGSAGRDGDRVPVSKTCYYQAATSHQSDCAVPAEGDMAGQRKGRARRRKNTDSGRSRGSREGLQRLGAGNRRTEGRIAALSVRSSVESSRCAAVATAAPIPEAP